MYTAIRTEERLQQLTVTLEERVRERSAELFLSEQRYRLMVDAVQDYCVYFVNEEGVITEWTESAQRLHGHSRAQMLGEPYTKLLAIDNAQRATVAETFHQAHERLYGRRDPAGLVQFVTLCVTATGNSGPPSWLRALELVDEANARGADIRPQVLPRAIGIVAGFEVSTHPFCLCPSYLPIATLPLEQQLEPAIFVPESLTGMELLQQVRLSNAHMVLVVDEYGDVQGLITQQDLLEAVTGEFQADDGDDPSSFQREDGSWLLDGLLPAVELRDCLGLRSLPDEREGRYQTLAGMMLWLLGRLPETGDSADWQGWRLEVVDLDGKRIDKVLATPLPANPAEDDG